MRTRSIESRDGARHDAPSLPPSFYPPLPRLRVLWAAPARLNPKPRPSTCSARTMKWPAQRFIGYEVAAGNQKRKAANTPRNGSARL